jgi:ribonuclease D
VRRITKSEIDKSARFTDWSRRPLSKRQLEYALADVTHLREIYRTLSKELERTERSHWVEEEEAALKDPETYRLDPGEAWRRLKPRSLNKRFLTVLVAVAAWREREAQVRDVPRNRILKDEALLEIAAHPPATPEALAEIRAIPSGYAQSRHGKAIVAAVKAGLESSLPDRMPVPQRPRVAEPPPPVLDLLRTLLRVKAHQYRVAPRLVADTEDLERLATGDDEGVAALHGWRAEVFGRDAIALREGRLAIALEGGEAVVIEVGGAPRTQPRMATARTTGRG